MTKTGTAKKIMTVIRLRITRSDGRTSEVSIGGDDLTPLMMEAAEGLLYAMCNNARMPPRTSE